MIVETVFHKFNNGFYQVTIACELRINVICNTNIHLTNLSCWSLLFVKTMFKRCWDPLKNSNENHDYYVTDFWEIGLTYLF